MQSLSAQLRNLFRRRQHRRAASVLMRFALVVVGVVGIDTVLFQIIAREIEGQTYSWVTAFYWTLSMMTTLGVGDVVLTSDLGRLFTIVVLISGIVLFLVVLPFAFIRYFYAPWLESSRVSPRMAGHVVLTAFDNIALPLIEKLELHRVPYYVIEPNSVRASNMRDDGISVISGPSDDATTYERLHVVEARLVLANDGDAANTSIALTVRGVAPRVPIAALADTEGAVDVLRLAGATHVLPLKQELGGRLASRLNAGHAQAHVIGSFRNLLVAEFSVYQTPFAGRTIRELGLREAIGVNVVGVLDHARFLPARPDTLLTDERVPVVLGTAEDIQALDEFLVIYDTNPNPVILIGGGKVGCAACMALKKRGIPVHVINRTELGFDWGGEPPDRLFIGDATRREVLLEAGLEDAPGVILTTNDDAMNAYLAIHCRRLVPPVRILSRLTKEHNMAAMQRAGVDVVLSLTSIGVESIFALLSGDELVVLGGGVEFHELPLPASLVGKTLAEAEIATRSGLNVIAIERGNELTTNLVGSTPLVAGSSLLMVGDQSQLKSFVQTYG